MGFHPSTDSLPRRSSGQTGAAHRLTRELPRHTLRHVSAQPVHHEPDPRDPEVILARLADGERDAFLREYRKAAQAAAQDPHAYKELRRVLAVWSLIADTEEDPAYHQALAAVRAGEPGLSIDQVTRMRHAG